MVRLHEGSIEVGNSLFAEDNAPDQIALDRNNKELSMILDKNVAEFKVKRVKMDKRIEKIREKCLKLRTY